jgi:hypothetical protein
MIATRSGGEEVEKEFMLDHATSSEQNDGAQNLAYLSSMSLVVTIV